uniref:Uncharacterized protein n=1 Tax=Setaria viridis TaxID=4556 RepID=A0A4U6U1L1_SETVI|nr:hypothetical protein SEVIR_6G088650v2 [Setaria viridis]
MVIFFLFFLFFDICFSFFFLEQSRSVGMHVLGNICHSTLTMG